MLKIKQLTLPDKYPTDETINSWGDIHHGYEPESWEACYDLNRYLEHVPQNVLDARYIDICKNLRCLTSEDRHIIPRQTFLSSWYWFRKEHQTRYEFYLRKAELPQPPPSDPICKRHVESPIRPQSPNACDILFRSCEPNYIESLIDRGNLLVKAASEFDKLEKDKTRKDDELNRDTFITGNRLRVTTLDGSRSSAGGNYKSTTSCKDYYIFCTAYDFDTDLVKEFGGACAVIKDVDEFAKRLNRAAQEILNGWQFFHDRVQYYDPYDNDLSQDIITPIHKDFRFAYQREYRFLWQHSDGAETPKIITLDLGCLKDIAERI
ncbi:MAG: hypothetical protein AB7E46_14615 [Desulfovibrio sp.]|jgi:hypothetical protein